MSHRVLPLTQEALRRLSPDPPLSQPELVGNQIVRFVTKQAPAPQALKVLGGAREGEEGRVLY